jgi:ketosteroid isomerase-like protein
MKRSIVLTGLVFACQLLWQGARARGNGSLQSASLRAVWQREADYWRYVKAGDVTAYVKLWDERFVGWPCATAHPAHKNTIGTWVQRIRDEHVQFSYELTREDAADYGDLVVVYYTTPIRGRYPDGRTYGADTVWKFTHTWRRDGGAWRIVGGMCGLPFVGQF